MNCSIDTNFPIDLALGNGLVFTLESNGDLTISNEQESSCITVPFVSVYLLRNFIRTNI